MLAVFNKELRSYFVSMTGYIFMAVFLLISGIFFAMTNLLTGSAYFNSVLQNISFIFLLLVPVITMKSIAEETHLKTDQLLYTAPLTLPDIIIGKYLAAVVLFLITLAVTILYPLILSEYGKLAGWEILGNYIGFALMGSSFIAVGIFISSLTENQVTSAVGTFGALLFIWLIDGLTQGIPTSMNSGIIFAVILLAIVCAIVYSSTRNYYVMGGVAAAGGIAIIVIYLANKALYEGFTVKFLGWFSLLKRYNSFSMGMLDVSSIIYYISFSAAFIYLTIRMIDKRRWS